MSKKSTIVLAIVVIIILVILAIVFTDMTKEEEAEETAPETTEEAEEPAIEEMDLANEIYGISGEITAINGNTLSVKALIPLASEDESPVIATAKVVVGENTKIIKMVLPEGADETASPEEVSMAFNELKIGDIVDVATSENVSNDIKARNEFTASFIYISE